MCLTAFLNSQRTEEQRKGYEWNGNETIANVCTNLAAGKKDAKSAQRAYETFLDDVKSQAWDTIISGMGLDKYMTSSMEKTMQRFRKAQGNFELTKENIMALFQLLMSNLGNIMKTNIVSVYDTFTRFYKDNTSYTEGWKTNKQYRANRKIVLPDMVEAGWMPQRYGYKKTFSVNWNRYPVLDDIDKAMCWLSGRQFEDLDGAAPDRTSIRQVIDKYPVGDTAWATSAFFLVKCFKKGTIHLQFRDEDLLNKFNLAVNEGKNELGAAE